jgi:hypothetical protein
MTCITNELQKTFSRNSLTHIYTYIIMILYVSVATHGHSLVCDEEGTWDGRKSWRISFTFLLKILELTSKRQQRVCIGAVPKKS